MSGAGRNGVIDLENGIKNYVTDELYCDSIYTTDSSSENLSANKEKNKDCDFSSLGNVGYSLKKFNYPIFSNCLPHIDVFLKNGYTKEEEKMINETRKILKKPDLRITATTVRVPVFNSHSESINVEFEKDFNMGDLIKTLSDFPGIIIQDNIVNTSEDNSVKTDAKEINEVQNPIYPLAINASGHDEVFVGRIRRDESVASGVNLWVVADNIRKGAASNAVQIVEKLIQQI